MGRQIIQQPDGGFAVFSTETNTFVIWDATAGEIVEVFAAEAAARSRRTVRTVIGHVTAGNVRAAYAQFALTWEQALARDQAHGGEAHIELAERGPGGAHNGVR